MANVAQGVVQFYRGPAAQLPEASQRNADSLYFTTDTHRLYLGDHEYCYYTAGAGIDITNNTISIDSLQPGDIAEIVSPLPDALTIDLNDIADVNLGTPVDGQALVYNATSQKWVNGYPGVPSWADF